MVSKLALLFHFLIISALIQVEIVIVAAQPQVPCHFIFGDSSVDNGNNNRLITQAKANYLPYGIDFPLGPTGRFTNGRTAIDLITEQLGFSDFIEAFDSVTNQEISRGVNYGSGAAGIRDDTGTRLGGRYSMNAQLLNHGLIMARLQLLQRNITFTNEYLKKCIYTVNMGRNDYINNYLMPTEYPLTQIYTPEGYADALIQQYSQQLRRLYGMGARKIAVFGLGPIGCAPKVIADLGTDGVTCVESVNDIIRLFDNRLNALVDELNNNFAETRFTFINTSSISSPEERVGRRNVPCCQIRSDGQCVPNSIPCPNRNSFVWFDGYHPTEASNRVIGRRAYNAASRTDASPVDIRSLAQL